MSRTPLFELYVGTKLCVSKELDAEEGASPSVALDEASQVVFTVDPRESDQDYEVRIGDVRISRPHLGRAIAEWSSDAHLDSARGSTTIALYSKNQNDAEDSWRIRATLQASVCPSKLSEAVFRGMIDDLASLSAGLLLDLISKSSGGQALVSSAPRVSVRSAQADFQMIAGLWPKLSRAVSEIIESPYTTLAQGLRPMSCSGSERFSPQELSLLVARGIDPRRRETPRPFAMLRTVSRRSMDTPEHRTLCWFLGRLIERVRDCQRRALQECRGIDRDKWVRERIEDDNGQSLYDSTDLPRIDRLRRIARQAGSLISQMRNARSALGAESSRFQPADLGASSIVRKVRQYHDAWHVMRDYLAHAGVLIDSGVAERSKQTWRMYEQWVFLQLAAAFRRSGLRCIAQSDFLGAISRHRFTVDLERGARLEFLADDHSRIVLRYEPWVLPKDQAVLAGETVYKGHRGDIPWSPDILIESFRSGPEGPDTLDYAVVVDAKYVRKIRPSHLQDCHKYIQIRSAKSDAAVTRQVWLANPTAGGIVPEDDAIRWTDRGPSVPRTELVLGTIGMMPSGRAGDDRPLSGEPVKSAVDFVRGLLTYLQVALPA